MIILHSHLQPQFKNELFHILHNKNKSRKISKAVIQKVVPVAYS